MVYKSFSLETIPAIKPTSILTTNYVPYTMSFTTVPEIPIGSAVVLKEEPDTICTLCPVPIVWNWI